MGTLLAVVLLFFLVGFIVAIARHVLSSQVRGTAQSAALGTLAQEIAKSAVEEACVEVQRLLNDPANNDLFRELRKEDGGSVLWHKMVPVPLTKAQASADELLRGFEVEGWAIDAELMGRRPLGHVVYENVGTFRFSGAVRHKATGVRRQLQMERSYTMALLSTPRPYDQFTLSVLNPQNLYEKQTGWANAQMNASADAMNRLRDSDRPGIIERLQTVIQVANARLGQARTVVSTNPGVVPDGSVPADELKEDELVVPIREADLRQPPTLYDEVTPPKGWTPDRGSHYHHFASNVVLSTKAHRIDDLSLAFLRPRLERIESGRIDPAVKQYQKTFQEFWQVTTQILELCRIVPPLNEIDATLKKGKELHERLKQIVKQLKVDLEAVSRTNMELLDEAVKYTDFFIESVDQAADWLRSFAYKLDLEEWRKKATFVFGGDGCAERFVKLLSDTAARGQSLNGIVFIDNTRPEDDLKLVRATIHGKLVIVTAGNASLQDVSLAKFENDLLTVCCGGTLRASGRVQASLIPRREFKPKDLRLDGNLIFENVENPEDLTGSVENEHVRDSEHGRYFSGYAQHSAPEYLYAAWSPWPSWTQVLRY